MQYRSHINHHSTTTISTTTPVAAAAAIVGTVDDDDDDEDVSKDENQKLKKSQRYVQYRNNRNGQHHHHHHHAVSGSSTITTSSRATRHGNNSRHYDRRQRSLHRVNKQKKIIRRSHVITCLMCFIILLLCSILMITHTLGIRLWKKSLKSIIGTSQEEVQLVPYPSSSIQISVILMNHARPYILQQSQLLSTLVTHPNVQSIYILHSNPKTQFNNTHLISHLLVGRNNVTTVTTTTTTSIPPSITVSLINQKIKHIDAITMNEQMGLAIRFHYCSILCTNTPYVLHIDDDMEFTSHNVINTLINAMIQNPHRIVGHYGRKYNIWYAPFRHGYDTKTIYGEDVEVVLTKILLLEQILCTEFFKYTYLIDDIRHNPTSNNNHMVQWNGEDIFMNIVANYYYHVPMYGPYQNYAIATLDVWDVDTSQFDISTTTTTTTSLQQQQQQQVSLLPKQQQLRQNGNTYNNNNNNNNNIPVLLENAVSGNMDRNRIWNVGLYQWYIAYQKAQIHTKYRGLLWYTTKQRLYKLRQKKNI